MIIATLANFRSISRAVVCAFVVSATSVAATLVEAEPTTYLIDRDVTQVEYVAHAFGVIRQRGRFADMRGTIVFDQEMERGDVDFDIDARSLTLRGVTQDVTLTVMHCECANSPAELSSPDCQAQAATTIRRSAFGMDSFAPFLGDEVDLRFSVVARRTEDAVTGR